MDSKLMTAVVTVNLEILIAQLSHVMKVIKEVSNFTHANFKEKVTI